MTKRTAEDLVAEWERSGVATVNLDELKALIASWRERGEALKEISEFVRISYSASGKDDREFPSEEAAIAIAALKDKP